MRINYILIPTSNLRQLRKLKSITEDVYIKLGELTEYKWERIAIDKIIEFLKSDDELVKGNIYLVTNMISSDNTVSTTIKEVSIS